MVKKGVILPLGATGESDDVFTYFSSVIYKDGYFWMYYSGYDGTNVRTCLALSKDGINFVKKGVILPLGANGESDDVFTSFASIIYKDGYFWMYYTGLDGAYYRICLALSKDGISFTKKGVVLPLGANGESDDGGTFTASIIYKDGYFWMYYTGLDGAYYFICLAISKDGINFTKKGVILIKGATGESDDLRVYPVSIIYKDGYFWMYYGAYDGTVQYINLAISKDGINFTKKGVVLPLGASGESDDNTLYPPSIIYKDGYFWMYYSGYDGASVRICLALSKDGIT